MTDNLNEGHRRVISSGMLIVDSAAARMIDLLDGRHSRSSMQRIEGSLTVEEKAQVRDWLRQLQAMIVAFANKYDLHASQKNLRRILASDASQIWVSLEDTRPTRLRGYGYMTEATANDIESDLAEMLGLADRLNALLNA